MNSNVTCFVFVPNLFAADYAYDAQETRRRSIFFFFPLRLPLQQERVVCDAFADRTLPRVLQRLAFENSSRVIGGVVKLPRNF